MLTFHPDELMTIRELALELFWSDDTHSKGYQKSVFISNEVLEATGCWSEAEAEMYNQMRG